MAKALVLALLVLLGTIGFSAYAYTVYLPSLATASPGSGTLNIYLADPPPSNQTLKYLLVNVTSVTLKYSSNVTETSTTSSSSSTGTSTTSATSAIETTTTANGSVNRFVYNVSSSVGTNVNLTKYQGSALLLGSPKVPTGNVTGIVLNISGARAFWTNGTSTQLKVVANGKLMVNVQFTIGSGDTADMNISITPSSVHVSQGNVLRPVLLVSVTRSPTTSSASSTSSAASSSTSSTTSSTTSSSSSSQSST
ncbi:MAG: hypothetical protein JRN28_02000 [Nitrososphaerota archaeon]|nr:hypothetical protein [Nitrososphaerota archaeon]